MADRSATPRHQHTTISATSTKPTTHSTQSPSLTPTPIKFTGPREWKDIPDSDPSTTPQLHHRQHPHLPQPLGCWAESISVLGEFEATTTNLFLAPSAECQPTRSLRQHGPRIKFIAFPDLAQGQTPLHNSEDLEQPINDYIRQPWTAAWSSKGLFSIPRENTTYPSSSATSCPTLSSLHNPQCGGRKIAASHPCYSRSQGPRPHSLHFRPQNSRKPRQLHLCPPTTSVGRMELLSEPHLQQRQGEVRQLIFDVGAFVDGYHLGAPDNLGLVC